MMTQITSDCVARYSQVVDCVAKYASDVHDNSAMAFNLASLESIKGEFSQIRADLLRRSCEVPELDMKENFDRQMVAADYTALQEYQHLNPSLVLSPHDTKCDESGRVVKLHHLGGTAEQLAPLEMLSGLESLIFQSTRVEDGTPFSRLPSLKNLSVNYHSLNTRKLGPMVSLEHFQGKNCWMDDLNWLRYCPLLKKLELPHSGIQSIVLPKLPERIEFLDLSSNPLESIKALTGHPAIQILSIAKTHIRDLSPLLTLPSLSALRISEDMLGLTGFAECQEYLNAKGGIVGVIT